MLLHVASGRFLQSSSLKEVWLKMVCFLLVSHSQGSCSLGYSHSRDVDVLVSSVTPLA
jgi:hypothetical protein